MLLLVALLAALVSPIDPPKDGTEVVQRMHARYAGKWYRTLSFVQTTSYPDGRRETWYEAAEIPGKLRIDVAPIDSGNVVLFRADSVYQFKQGVRAAAQPMIHPLMVLGFDVYAQGPDRTIEELRDLGFDLSRVREDSWQGRKAWVVGSVVADPLAREFWVDQERLVFVRLVQLAPRSEKQPGKRTVGEIQFNNYEPLGGGWIAPEVAFFNNGEKVMLERYEDVRADPALPAELFDPSAYRRPGWVK